MTDVDDQKKRGAQETKEERASIESRDFLWQRLWDRLLASLPSEVIPPQADIDGDRTSKS